MEQIIEPNDQKTTFDQTHPITIKVTFSFPKCYCHVKNQLDSSIHSEIRVPCIFSATTT